MGAARTGVSEGHADREGAEASNYGGTAGVQRLRPPFLLQRRKQGAGTLVADQMAQEAVRSAVPHGFEVGNGPAQVYCVAFVDRARPDKAAAALARVRLALVRRVERQPCRNDRP